MATTGSVVCNGYIQEFVANPTPETIAELQYNNVVIVNFSEGVNLWLHCPDGITNLYIGEPQPLSIPELDPVLVAGAIGAGFFCLLPVWAAVYGFRSLLTSIGR